MAVAMRHLHDPVPSVRAKRPEVSPRVDAIVARALAKRPRDRFPSMEGMTAALEAALVETRKLRAREAEEDTGVMPAVPAAPAQGAGARRSAAPRLRVVALLLLAVGVLVAGLVAAQMGREEGILGSGDGAADAAVRLGAVSDFDPDGDGQEHSSEVPLATDRNQSTAWSTESYESFSKPGVGIVLSAPKPVALSQLEIASDEPGFTARIRASESEAERFVDVSAEKTVGARTEFPIDTGGKKYRYYLIWITDPNGRAHVNEVRARAAG